MIPDLGKYAFEVLAAYGVSIALLIAIIALSIRRSRKIQAQLEMVEAAREKAK